MKKWLLGIAMLCALSVGHAREPKVMGGTVASYTYFPAELSSTASSGGGLPTVTAGQACTAGEEGKAGVTSAGVLLTCSAGTYSDPKLPPLVEEGDGCRNSVVNGVVDGVVDASLNGRVGRSTIGLTLSCQSGYWRRSNDLARFIGQQINCSLTTYRGTDFYARVNNSARLELRVWDNNFGDSGWIDATSVGAPFGYSSVQFTGIGIIGTQYAVAGPFGVSQCNKSFSY